MLRILQINRIDVNDDILKIFPAVKNYRRRGKKKRIPVLHSPLASKRAVLLDFPALDNKFDKYAIALEFDLAGQVGIACFGITQILNGIACLPQETQITGGVFYG